MADRNPIDSPVVHDIAREAVDSARGYNYQILQSVLAWLNLRDGEILYLEGAEDLDRVGVDEVSLTQVKDTAGSGSITLRTLGVIEALNHFWTHRARNRNRTIRFRYVTTSPIGLEQGDPLGEGLGALQLWIRAQEPGDATVRLALSERLQHQLVQESRLSVPIREWLQKASVQEVLTDLIEPMTWDARAPDSEGVTQRIRDALAAYGDRKGIAAADSEQVLDILCTEAWRVATKEHSRALTFVDFIRLFDQATRISLPKSDTARLLARLSGAAMTGEILNAVLSLRFEPSPIPPVPLGYFERPNLRAQLADMAARDTIVIQGATGMGKTVTVASFAAASDRPWMWVNLRGLVMERAAERIRSAGQSVREGNTRAGLVLDDLDLSGDSRILEGSLAQLAGTSRQRGGLLMITTAHEMSPRLMSAVGVATTNKLRMPAFSVDEITQYLSSRGCTDQVSRETWATLLFASTQGHPQLLSARIAVLEAAQFSLPKAEDLITTPAEVLDVQQEARRLLAQLDLASRELIYRATLMDITFTRASLMEVAQLEPAIAEAGNAMDRLVGPWIEVIGTDRYRTSPLAHGAGDAAHGMQWSMRVHSAIARSIVRERVLTPEKVASALLHATLSGDAAVLAKLSIGLLTAKDAVWNALAAAAPWFMYVGLGEGKLVGVLDKNRFHLRFLQFRFAVAAGDANMAHSIQHQFEAEVPAGPTEEFGRLARLLFFGQVLIQTRISYSLSELTDVALAFAGLADDLNPALEEVLPEDLNCEFQSQITGPDGKLDRAMISGVALLPRITDLDGLEQVLSQIERANPTLTRKVLWTFGRNETLARLWLERIALSLYQSETPDWLRLTALTQRVYALARALQIPGMAQAAAQRIVRMTDEDLGQWEQALQLSAQFDADLGEVPSLQAERARVFARHGSDAEARTLWKAALPRWRVEFEDLSPSYACRDAALAAARSDSWDEAAQWLREARTRADGPDQLAYRIGLTFDIGYALTRSKDFRSALQMFSEGVEALLQLPQPNTEGALYSAQRRAGHVLHVVVDGVRGKDVHTRLSLAGWASNLEPLKGVERVQTPLDFFVSFLVELEFITDQGDALFRKYHGRLLQSPLVAIRQFHLDVALRRSVATLQLEELVSLAANFLHTTKCVGEYHREGGLALTQPIALSPRLPVSIQEAELILLWLVFGAIALSSRSRLGAAPLLQWRREAEDWGVTPVVQPFLDAYEEMIIERRVTWHNAIGSSGVGWAVYVLASFLVSEPDTLALEQLLELHGWACYVLGQFPYRDVIARDFATVIQRQWARWLAQHNNEPGSTTRHALQAALDSSPSGWVTVKQILRAALALDSAAPDQVRAAIENIKE